MLSEAQLRRHFAGIAVPPQATWFRRNLRPLSKGGEEVELKLLSLGDAFKSSTGLSLGHALGAAEMRLVLGGCPASWRADADALGGGHRPDAVWFAPTGRTAIEYDSGAYLSHTIYEKLMRFTRYPGGLVWGVPGEVRSRRLLERLGAGVRVLRVDYWS